MDPDKTLATARAMVHAWEEAVNADAEHAAARELSSAFAALDDLLTHGGPLPAEWNAQRGDTIQVLQMVREFVQAAAEAVTLEKLPPGTRERIVNRLLWGDPDGIAGITRAAVKARSISIHPSAQPYDPASDEPDLEELSGDEAVTVTTWHALTGTPVAPELTHPVFGSDLREIHLSRLDQDSVHPLLATCSCGGEITRQLPGQPWVHTPADMPAG